jgi:nucleotide-binding universal stress UspA family protein
VTVVAPVRYPLSSRSERTLRRAVEIAEERELPLTVLHVNLYQNGRKTTRRELKAAVERSFGPIESARYLVREGLLVEETILEEIHAEVADVVVIGERQAGRWRRLLRRIAGQPDVEGYLREQLDCELVVVGDD